MFCVVQCKNESKPLGATTIRSVEASLTPSHQVQEYRKIHCSPSANNNSSSNFTSSPLVSEETLGIVCSTKGFTKEAEIRLKSSTQPLMLVTIDVTSSPPRLIGVLLNSSCRSLLPGFFVARDDFRQIVIVDEGKS